MKSKWQLWTGLAGGIATVIFLVLAYVFMWWPVVTKLPPSSSASICTGNLREIDAAIKHYAFVQGKTNGTSITIDQIKPYFRLTDEFDKLHCPAGGTYSVTVVGADPTCSIGTNLNSRVRIGYFHWDYRWFHLLP